MEDNDVEVLKGQVHTLNNILTGFIIAHQNPKFFYELMKSAAVDREQAKTISVLSRRARAAADDLFDYFLCIAASAASPSSDEGKLTSDEQKGQ